VDRGAGDAFVFHAAEEGTNFKSVSLPSTAQGSLILHTFDGMSDRVLSPGDTFSLGAFGVGLNVFELVNDPQDLVVGLMFEGTDPSDIGLFTVISALVATQMPEPSALIILIGGLGLRLAATSRRLSSCRGRMSALAR
jgi:hypothetical protein